MESPEIVGLCGSLSADSTTHRALSLALQAARGAGAQTRLLDLRELQLPFAGGDWRPDEWPDAETLVAATRGADGLIWATPEYHGSFSGVLKNALDLCAIPDFEGKVVALVGVAGGQIGAIQALSHLRTVARQLHLWALPHQVSIARAYNAFGQDGRLTDPKLAQSIETLGAELVKWSALHRAASAPPTSI